MRAYPLISLVTAPAGEPITTAEAKTYLRVSDSTDDALIASFIVSARVWIESYLRRKLRNTQSDYAYPTFPCAGMPLYVPHAPLVSVDSIKYYDSDGVIQTLDTANYRAHTKAGALAGRGYIELTQAADLPSVDVTVENPVIVRATCGYGADATTVPDGIKAALYLTLGDMYEQRQESVAGGMGKSQLTVERLLAPYRLLEAI